MAAQLGRDIDASDFYTAETSKQSLTCLAKKKRHDLCARLGAVTVTAIYGPIGRNAEAPAGFFRTKFVSVCKSTDHLEATPIWKSTIRFSRSSC